MKILSIVLAAAFLLLFAAEAVRADVKIVYETEVKGDVDKPIRRNEGESETVKSQTVAYFKSDRARLEDPTGQMGPKKGILIYRLDKGLVWLIDSEKKSYEEFIFEDMKKLPQPGKVEFTVSRSDEVQEFAGRECIRFLSTIKSTGIRMAITTTTLATKELSIDPAMKEFIEKAVKDLDGLGVLQARFKSLKALMDADVFPLKILVRTSLMGKHTQATSIFRSVSMDKLDDSLFEIPEDFTKVDQAAPVKEIRKRSEGD